MESTIIKHDNKTLKICHSNQQYYFIVYHKTTKNPDVGTLVFKIRLECNHSLIFKAFINIPKKIIFKDWFFTQFFVAPYLDFWDCRSLYKVITKRTYKHLKINIITDSVNNQSFKI